MISEKNITVKILSQTGDFVTFFCSNTDNGKSLSLVLNEEKIGGLIDFTLNMSNDIYEPIFTDMLCQIFLDGTHYWTGYAGIIPEADTNTEIISITGYGFIQKLKKQVINVSYTDKTLEYIIKDIASTYLTTELRVLYQESFIETPSISAIDIEFKDKTLLDVFTSLMNIANYDYQNAQYTFYIDKNRYFNFRLISQSTKEALFEGFDYQEPTIDKSFSEIINKILAYRTKSTDANAVEYVGTYQDTNSQGNYGTYMKKYTFPDYTGNSIIENICNAIIQKNKDPIITQEINNLEIISPKDIGFYRLISQRKSYLKTLNSMESLTGWNTETLISATASISNEHVLTNRTALKLVSGVGSMSSYMEYVFDPYIPFPSTFGLYVYKVLSASEYTIRLYDIYDNFIDIKVPQSAPIGQWLRFGVDIKILLELTTLNVNYSETLESCLELSPDGIDSGCMDIYQVIQDGVFNISKVRIIIDSNSDSEGFFDQLDLITNAYIDRTLILEQVEYTLNKSYVAKCTLGNKSSSIVDEIKEKVKDGSNALEIFSKQ